MRAGLLFILMTTSASICTSRRAVVQELQKCGTARVQYTPFDDSYSGRIQINSLRSSDGQPATSERILSPQRTRWLTEILPDTMKPGPWTTRVYIGAGPSDPDVELRFVDDAYGGANIRWLNEKPIFGEVWWGRIYATDFIFDVEQRKFIYREMAHFGELMEPCQ
jgi:hypothetical protein